MDVVSRTTRKGKPLLTCSEDVACSGALSSRTRSKRGNRREIPLSIKRETPTIYESLTKEKMKIQM